MVKVHYIKNRMYYCCDAVVEIKVAMTEILFESFGVILQIFVLMLRKIKADVNI